MELSELEQYKVDIPEGERGVWKVSKYSVSKQEEQMMRLRCMFNPQRPERWVPEGTYTALTRYGSIIMSDTPDEIRDHLAPILNTHKGAHCLVGGLGIGMVTEAMLKRSESVQVTVIELSQDVIDLVGPTLKERYGDRLEIVKADIMKWRAPRGSNYDVVWFDIWDNIAMENLPEMRKLANKAYAKRADWVGCWQEDGCAMQKYRVKNKIGWY